MIKSRICLLVCVFLFAFSPLYSQSIESLRNEKKKIEKEISYLNHLLNKNSKTKSVTLNKLDIVQSKIYNREKLISNIMKESDMLVVNINKNKSEIYNTISKINTLKKQYADIIYKSWLHKSNKNKFIYILASADLNQAFIRLKYLKQYSDYTNNILEEIEKLREGLSERSKTLNSQFEDKKKLGLNLSIEKESLSNEREKCKDLIVSLSSQQKEFNEKLKKQLDVQENLNIKIKELIIAQSKKERTLDEKKLGNNFAENKNKLPWPTKSGFISSYFGVHQHPIAKKTQVRNDGIDISTSRNSKCYSVFTGKVSEVFNFPGLNNIVMVRHGDYLSVYANLSSIYVTKGQIVDTGDELGLVYTDPDEQKTILKFQIWKNSSKENPSDWLSKYSHSSN